MHQSFQSSRSHRVAVALNLEGGLGVEAAKDARARLVPADWAVLLEFAAAVLALQEAVATNQTYLVTPVSPELAQVPGARVVEP